MPRATGSVIRARWEPCVTRTWTRIDGTVPLPPDTQATRTAIGLQEQVFPDAGRAVWVCLGCGHGCNLKRDAIGHAMACGHARQFAVESDTSDDAQTSIASDSEALSSTDGGSEHGDADDGAGEASAAVSQGGTADEDADQQNALPPCPPNMEPEMADDADMWHPADDEMAEDLPGDAREWLPVLPTHESGVHSTCCSRRF